jgi:predicted KAP-like P-loop ATPase
MVSFSIKTKDILIDPQSPFDNDLLDREEEIKNLTNIIQNVEDPLVLAINAPWGTGKTTFIKLWRAYLEQQGQKTLYFNAWETDFAEDPLIVLVSKLDKWVTDDGKSKNEKWSKVKKDIVPKILERSLIAGIKAATFKVVDMDKEYEKIFADLSGEITGDLIAQFNQKSQAIKQFKDVIKESLYTLPNEQKNLIIFIDG